MSERYIGAAPIGVAFAQLFRRFGVEIRLLEERAQLLPKDDAEVAAVRADILVAEGIAIQRNTKLARVHANGEEKTLTLPGPSGIT